MNRNGTIMSGEFALNYTVRGQGQPILAIGSSVYYPRLFSEHFYTAFQLIALDHRGFVKPPRPLQPEDYTLDRIVEDIEAARQALGLEDFVLMGHSGHAFMAAAYARRYPEAVRKLVLLNTAPTNSPQRQQQSLAFFQDTASPERKRQFEQDIALLEGDLAKEPERRFVHMCIRMGAHSFHDYTFDASPMWDGVYTNMPVIDDLWGRTFAEHNLLPLLAELRTPVFLGLGRYDYLVGPVSLWDSVDDRYGHVRKVVFEASGHNPMLEEPEAFVSALSDWIHE